MFVQLIHIALT